MALFTLTDIKFNKGQKARTGKASSELVGGAYENNLYRYPQDLGNYDKGHYLVIHINEQIHTNYPGELTGDSPTIISNREAYGTASPFQNLNTLINTPGAQAVSQGITDAGSSIAETLNKVTENSPVLRGISDSVTGIASGAAVTASLILKGASSINGARTIRRTSDTIALYMPDTMAFTHQQTYDTPSLTGLPAAVLAGGASFAQSLKGATAANAGEISKKLAVNMSPYIANYAMKSILGNLGAAGFAAGFGMVQNPILEVLYTSPNFRSFRFDFMFYPKSESEAKEVQDIINRLQFHQAPEVRKESNGFFLVPPSEFDIKFYYNGSENPNIPQISTCVLETIDIDYAPNGFTTYEVPGQTEATYGGTGMPVAIRMSLQFKETEIMTKDHFQGTRRTQAQLDYSNSLGDFNG
jgi:hypothetical protein